MHTDYIKHTMANGIRLMIMPVKKFKTVSIGFFVHQELNEKFAALNALLPAVLEQGSRLYPDYLTLQRKLEDLYGAGLSTDIMKSGERHVLSFSLETAHSQYLGEDESYLQHSMSVLGSLIGDPLVSEEAFNADFVNQEKNQLIKDIKALLNDKGTYAFERCIAMMCAGERYGTFKLGSIEDYTDIDGAILYNYYQQLIANNPIDLYLVGDLNPAKAIAAAEAVFNFKRSKIAVTLPDTELTVTPKEVKYFEEEMVLNQSKLVIGFRTQTGFQDQLYCPLLVYSGILGSFPHSKLFMKVREEASLAYYINTRLEQHKGLMMITAGINYADYNRALEIIDQQLIEMVEGKISDLELDNTKKGLINRYRSLQDSPGQLIYFNLESMIGGKSSSVEELVEGIGAVDRQSIMAVAEKVRKDTVYLLRPHEGGLAGNEQ